MISCLHDLFSAPKVGAKHSKLACSLFVSYTMPYWHVLRQTGHTNKGSLFCLAMLLVAVARKDQPSRSN